MKRIWLVSLLMVVLSAQFALADWLLEPSVFEPNYYADQNSDVRKIDGYDHAKLIEHWKTAGLQEGRRSSPVFAVIYYLKENKDVAKHLGEKNYPEAARHWYEKGRQEGRPSHPDFKVRVYLEKNPDVAKTVGEHNYLGAINHYLKNGYREGRTAK